MPNWEPIIAGKIEPTRDNAWSSATDSAERGKREKGNDAWDEDDYNKAVETFNRLWPEDRDKQAAINDEDPEIRALARRIYEALDRDTERFLPMANLAYSLGVPEDARLEAAVQYGNHTGMFDARARRGIEPGIGSIGDCYVEGARKQAADWTDDVPPEDVPIYDQFNDEHPEHGGDAKVVDEHGQKWVSCRCGAQWSVNEMGDGGFDFEQVSHGEDEHFHDGPPDDSRYAARRKTAGTNEQDRKCSACDGELRQIDEPQSDGTSWVGKCSSCGGIGITAHTSEAYQAEIDLHHNNGHGMEQGESQEANTYLDIDLDAGDGSVAERINGWMNRMGEIVQWGKKQAVLDPNDPNNYSSEDLQPIADQFIEEHGGENASTPYSISPEAVQEWIRRKFPSDPDLLQYAHGISYLLQGHSKFNNEPMDDEGTDVTDDNPKQGARVMFMDAHGVEWPGIVASIDHEGTYSVRDARGLHETDWVRMATRDGYAVIDFYRNPDDAPEPGRARYQVVERLAIDDNWDVRWTGDDIDEAQAVAAHLNNDVVAAFDSIATDQRALDLLNQSADLLPPGEGQGTRVGDLCPSCGQDQLANIGSFMGGGMSVQCPKCGYSPDTGQKTVPAGLRGDNGTQSYNTLQEYQRHLATCDHCRGVIGGGSATVDDLCDEGKRLWDEDEQAQKGPPRDGARKRADNQRANLLIQSIVDIVTDRPIAITQLTKELGIQDDDEDFGAALTKGNTSGKFSMDNGWVYKVDHEGPEYGPEEDPRHRQSSRKRADYTPEYARRKLAFKSGDRVRCISHAPMFTGQGPAADTEGTYEGPVGDPANKLHYVNWDDGTRTSVQKKEIEKIARRKRAAAGATQIATDLIHRFWSAEGSGIDWEMIRQAVDEFTSLTGNDDISPEMYSELAAAVDDQNEQRTEEILNAIARGDQTPPMGADKWRAQNSDPNLDLNGPASDTTFDGSDY